MGIPDILSQDISWNMNHDLNKQEAGMLVIILCSTGYVKIAVVLCKWYNTEIHNGPHRMCMDLFWSPSDRSLIPVS